MKFLSNKFFFLLAILMVVSVTGLSIYKYYITKDYIFVVETSCNPDIENCEHRSCEIEDECPPNGWEYYKTYEMPASEFQNCKNEDCAEFCRNSETCILIQE